MELKKQQHCIAMLTLLLLPCINTRAQEVLDLNECRRRALEMSRGMKQADAKKQQTEALEQVALWQMLPKLTANGGYTWMDKSVNLLSEEQKDHISHIGDNVQSDIENALHQELEGFNIGSIDVGSLLADRMSDALRNADLSGRINGFGQEIVDGLTTDTRTMGVATITVTQPIYMGGKLLAAYRTAALVNQLSGVEYDKKRTETLIAVDEAYWQVVSLMHKKQLAETYAALLDTLEANVQLAVDADMATRGDLAKVRVKHGEAQMSLTKATNGLMLSKMLLAERCGMPLDSQFEIDTISPVYAPYHADTTTDMGEVYERRDEMRMLRIADSIAAQAVRIAAGGLKPNIAVSGGYLVSNPNLFDGFKNEWGGTWMAGVVINVPIAHPASIYALRAAKAKRREVGYQIDEAQEMIALQVKKLACEVELAYKKLDEAERNMDQAVENLKLAQESFDAGMIGSSDLMMAQTAWVQAESEVIDAKIEIEMSKTYLRQAEGR